MSDQPAAPSVEDRLLVAVSEADELRVQNGNLRARCVSLNVEVRQRDAVIATLRDEVAALKQNTGDKVEPST